MINDTNVNVPVATEAPPSVHYVPSWIRLLQEWKAVAWPAVAAVSAAICHLLGYASQNGTTAALGTYHLDRPTISQQYIVDGVVMLAALGLQIGFFLLIVAALLALHKRKRVQTLSRGISLLTTRRWIVLPLALVTLALSLSFTNDMETRADAMILKSAKEVGFMWMKMSIDEGRGLLGLYQLLQAAAIVLFAFLSWRIMTTFLSNRLAKLAFGMWATIQTFQLIMGYAFIFGVGATFRPYPIVAFSNQEQLCGKGAIPLLIGSDDKVYALLLTLDARAPNPRKVIAYLPRTEIKWMTVVGQEQLHLTAHLFDLRTLWPAVPANPDSKPDAPPSGSPTNNMSSPPLEGATPHG